MAHLHDAILILNSNVVTIRGDVAYDVNNEIVQYDFAQAQAKLVELQAEYQAKQYQRDRAAEYPSFAEQFDTLYHGGYDAWKATIDSVKAKYPKP
jgi:hypothetical protein